MVRVSSLLISIVLACCLKAVQAESDALGIADMKIAIGAPREAVLSRMEQHYHLIRQGERDFYFIADKRGSSVIYGQIGFKNGRVSWLSTDWGTFSNDAYALGQALISALASIGGSGAPITATVAESRSPGITLERILFQAGRREVNVVASSGPKIGERIFIQENLRE